MALTCQPTTHLPTAPWPALILPTTRRLTLLLLFAQLATAHLPTAHLPNTHRPTPPAPESTLHLLSTLLSLQDPALLDVHTRSVECLGQIAEAVGPGGIPEQQGLQLLSLAIPSLNVGYVDLKVAIYEASGQLAPVLKAAMAPGIPYLVPVALESLNAEDGIIDPLREALGEGEGEELGAKVLTGAIEEKAAALDMLS